MNNRHRLIYKLEREEKKRKAREPNKLEEVVFKSVGTFPIVSISFLSPILKVNEEYAFSLRAEAKQYKE